MPDILIKNEIGEDIAYEGVEAVTFRKVEGGTASFTYGLPPYTDLWLYVEEFKTIPAKTSYWTKAIAATKAGNIVTCSAPSFGTWLQTAYDAYKLSEVYYPYLLAVPGGALLSTAANNGALLFFDEDNKKIVEISESGGYTQNSRIVGDKILLIRYNCWEIFDPATKTVSRLKDNGTSTIGAYCYEVPGGLLLSGTRNNANSLGVYFLDYNTYSLSQLYDEGYSFFGSFRTEENTNAAHLRIHDCGDVLLFSSSVSSAPGLYMYDKTERSVTRLSSQGYNFFANSFATRVAYSTYTRQISEGVVIATSTAAYGTWWFSLLDKTLICLAETGTFNSWVETDDTLIGSHSTHGCVVYDRVKKVWYRPATTGLYNCVAFTDGGCVIGGNTTALGAKYYNASTGTLTDLPNSSYIWYYSCKVPGGCLMSASATGTGVWKFKESDGSFTQIYSNGESWRMVRHGDSVLMGSFTQSTQGFLFYKDGVVEYSNPTTLRQMCSILTVDDGWVISSHYNSTNCYFVDKDTGEYILLTNGVTRLGPYLSSWYGGDNYVKSSYDYNRKYGDFRILSSYDGYGLIFDEVNKIAVRRYQWASASETPNTNLYSQAYLPFQRIFIYDICKDCVLIISATGDPVLLNYITGTVYSYTNMNLTVVNDPSRLWQPYVKIIPVSGGSLIFMPPFKWKNSTTSSAGAQGVWFFDEDIKKLRRLYTEGYYNTYEEGAGGGYIYLSAMAFTNKLYYDAETHTITRVEDEI